MKNLTLLLLMLYANLAACSNQQAGGVVSASNPITAEVIYQSHQCSQSQPQAVWIKSQQQLQQIYANLRRSYIGGQSTPPTVDFSGYGVLLLAMGQKNTGGYGLNLVDETVSVVSGLLEVRVRWLEPKRGMMVTQALTSPCLLVKISQGDFSRIRISDQSGKTRFEINLE